MQPHKSANIHSPKNIKSSQRWKMEEKKGFIESAISSKTKKNLKFFNLGKDNNWKKLLDYGTAKKIENIFKKEMKELDYL